MVYQCKMMFDIDLNLWVLDGRSVKTSILKTSPWAHGICNGLLLFSGILQTKQLISELEKMCRLIKKMELKQFVN